MSGADLEALLARLEAEGLALEGEAVRLVQTMYGRLSLGDLLDLVRELADAGRVTPADLQRVQTVFGSAVQNMGANPEVFTPLLEQAVQKGVSGGLEMLSAQEMVGVFVPADRQRQFLEASTARFRRYWRAELGRVASDVQDTLVAGVRRGAGSEQVAAELVRRVGVSRSRALLIAQNELGNAAARAQELSQKELGVVHYVWRTAGDRRVRDSHRAREGNVYAFDDPPSGGNPGEAIRCRCVALGLPPGKPLPALVQQPAPELQFEQIRVGVQVGEVNSVLNRPATAQVLRGITRSGLGGYLRDPARALSGISFTPMAPGEMAGYVPVSRTITLSTSRPRTTFGSPWRAGSLPTVSSAGRTRVEAMQRSLVHELGHHLIELSGGRLGDIARLAYADPRVRFVSRRASSDWAEYFCESWVAYHYHRDSLKRHDPVGYTMVEEALTFMGLRRI